MDLPHELRHAYATHCLDRGTNPRAIQEAMGHKSLETTMGYLHAEALSVCSPLNVLPVLQPGLDSGSSASSNCRFAAGNPLMDVALRGNVQFKAGIPSSKLLTEAGQN